MGRKRMPTTHTKSGDQLSVIADGTGQFVVWNHELGKPVARKATEPLAIAEMNRLAKK